jgi:hypothetical protein
MFIWFGSALPRVEDPIPDTIGIDTVFAIAGAGGTIGAVLGSFTKLRSRKRTREWWTTAGLIGGLATGVAFYLVSLAAQVLS